MAAPREMRTAMSERHRDVWVLTYEKRPWTLNQERSLDKFEHRRTTKEWREAFFWLAKAKKIPPLVSATFTAHSVVPNRRHIPDPGNIYPAVKAAIDGIVDAGVLPKDTGDFVMSITLYPSELGTGNALVLGISGEPA